MTRIVVCISVETHVSYKIRVWTGIQGGKVRRQRGRTLEETQAKVCAATGRKSRQPGACSGLSRRLPTEARDENLDGRDIRDRTPPAYGCTAENSR